MNEGKKEKLYIIKDITYYRAQWQKNSYNRYEIHKQLTEFIVKII